MEKDRVLHDETGNTASRRDFLYQAAGAGLVVAASLVPQAGLAEAASRRRRRTTGRGASDTPTNAGVYHIVSDLRYPAGSLHYLALGVDNNNQLVLDEANEAARQIWEVLSDGRGGGQLRRARRAAGGYLSLFGTGGLKLSNVATDAVSWWWMKDGDATGYIHIQLGPDTTQVIHAEIKNSRLPGTVSLAMPSASAGYRWKLIPAHGDGIPEGSDQQAQLHTLIQKIHVPDYCDSQWHNPACTGNPATWTGSCSLANGQCTCIHSA